ncbi:DUF6308 family protein [Gordonia otitidis]|uniref:Uncharacterized protein n=1 Tax=Gordonia otitidis (strain DSM 44809 / CCUG 52243 / JCM 12355 / NBRC 100426 / IFM 10032) TaxID=1108044 RepID=H5THY2_GORO1|nr:DUF6308 family protein [Gordonia otitidis]GAB33090.1 hypothetical protein GOOTI_041_00020 [Gordonia otitidis NBRC 100426]
MCLLLNSFNHRTVTDEFTSDDLVALTLLSVNVPGQAALRILGDRDLDYRASLNELLRQIPTEVELVDASDELLKTAEKRWSQVRQNHNVGRTKTSKLSARKRSHLLPVIDSVVTTAVGHIPGKHNFYRDLRAALNADDRRLHNHLIALRDKASIGSDISAIGVFEILAWMWGSGRSPVDDTDTRQPPETRVIDVP